MADQPDILRPEGTLDAKGKPLPTPGQPKHNFPGEYIPSERPDCPEEDAGGWGRAAASYPYIWYGNLSEEDFDAANEFNPCRPWYHSTATIDSLQISGTLDPGIFSTGANINMGTGHITAAQMTATTFNGVATHAKGINAEAFDIPHLKNEKLRIRHVVAEGPEAGIYVRGRLSGENVIKLPEYWDGLIDPSTITVTLTQIRTSQDLIVDAIEWGKVIKIKSGNASAIDCFYEVWAARWLNPMDHSEKLHVVYEGDSPADYPGNNKMFLVGGWDYDRRETKWRRPEDEVDSVDLDADA